MSESGASPAIMVVGSINVDLVFSTSRLPSAGETLTGAKLVELPGGKGANQTRREPLAHDALEGGVLRRGLAHASAPSFAVVAPVIAMPSSASETPGAYSATISPS
jgi:hypothetical protein